MIKKITAIALSALLLTACHAEEKEQQSAEAQPAETEAEPAAEAPAQPETEEKSE